VTFRSFFGDGGRPPVTTGPCGSEGWKPNSCAPLNEPTSRSSSTLCGHTSWRSEILGQDTNYRLTRAGWSSLATGSIPCRRFQKSRVVGSGYLEEWPGAAGLFGAPPLPLHSLTSKNFSLRSSFHSTRMAWSRGRLVRS